MGASDKPHQKLETLLRRDHAITLAALGIAIVNRQPGGGALAGCWSPRKLRGA